MRAEPHRRRRNDESSGSLKGCYSTAQGAALGKRNRSRKCTLSGLRSRSCYGGVGKGCHSFRAVHEFDPYRVERRRRGVALSRRVAPG